MDAARELRDLPGSEGKGDVMTELIRRMTWSGSQRDIEPLVTREWLVTNGLGGYASGTIAGVATRRYHGVLIAAMPAPLGRMMMLNHLRSRCGWPTARPSCSAVKNGCRSICKYTAPST
jgi:hypothetical protein